VEPLIGDTSDGTVRVIFFNVSDGVVLGFDERNNDTATLWHTTDGGLRWTPVVPQTNP
jgi:hypothetical protein